MRRRHAVEVAHAASFDPEDFPRKTLPHVSVMRGAVPRAHVEISGVANSVNHGDTESEPRPVALALPAEGTNEPWTVGAQHRLGRPSTSAHASNGPNT